MAESCYTHHHRFRFLSVKTTTTTTASAMALVAIATLMGVPFLSLPTADARLVDLSHDLEKDTYMALPDMPLYTTEVFLKEELMPGVFVEANTYGVSEHGGTHVDAPLHFYQNRSSLEQLPIESTVGDGIMIDCTQEVAEDPLYKLTLKKVQEWEEENGEIPRQAAVVLNFGRSQYYKNGSLYLGTNDTQDSSTYRFPTVGVEAIDFLVDERDIKILAMDVMSPDMTGSSFPVHIKLANLNKLVVENVKDPWKLPAKGFRFFATPVKFVGATGVQTRVFALVDEEGCSGGSGRAFISASGGSLVLALASLLLFW